jgi:phage terminase large subunit-like protein
MAATTTTRSRSTPKAPGRKSHTGQAQRRKKSSSRELGISPEVLWYLESRGIPVPDKACAPAVRTPEPRDVPGARFDPERVDRVLRVFCLLRHTKGEWAGRPLNPDPWQVAYVIAPVFGWVRRNEHGEWVRIIRNLYVELPRKNGKTTTCGGIAIYLTTADDEPGAEVVAAAAGKQQAGYCFDPIKALAKKSPALAPHVKALAGKITHLRSGSYFMVVSAVADLMHGANLHGAVIDELHVHKKPDLVETIETGTGSRRQPLIATITTADDGRPGTIYARKRDYVEKLARRVFTDPTTYGVVFAADRDDDPFDEATWRKANPGYGISPTREYMQAAAAKAQQSPADLATFLRLHLGIRTKQVTKYITLPVWDASAGLVDETKLEGRACRGGLDLAATSDVNALCLSFPDDEDGMDSIWRFWIPRAAADALSERTARQAEVWEREGWLKVTDGDVVDYDVIADDIIALADRFDIKTLGYDRRFFANVITKLTDAGVECVPVPQTYNELTAPTKELLRLLLKKRYRHGGNPVMRWMVDNLAVEQKPEVGLKPTKEHSGDKIDGVTAAVNALREHLYAEPDDGPSVYETRGLVTV